MKNLKISLVIISLFIGINSISAQFHWGVKGGLSLSRTTTDSWMNEYKPGFHLGLSTQYLFSDKIGLESGLYYSGLGGESSIKLIDLTGISIGNSEINFNTNYLQVPVLFLYRFNMGKNLLFYPTGGIYFGYGMSGKIKSDDDSFELRDRDGTVIGDHNWFEFDHVNRFDMGYSLGLNWQYTKITLGLAYERGLTNLTNDGGKFKNQNFKLSLGYLFQ